MVPHPPKSTYSACSAASHDEAPRWAQGEERTSVRAGSAGLKRKSQPRKGYIEHPFSRCPNCVSRLHSIARRNRWRWSTMDCDLDLYGSVLNADLSNCHLALGCGSWMMIAALSPWVCGVMWVHTNSNFTIVKHSSWVDRNRQFVAVRPTHVLAPAETRSHRMRSTPVRIPRCRPCVTVNQYIVCCKEYEWVGRQAPTAAPARIQRPKISRDRHEDSNALRQCCNRVAGDETRSRGALPR